MVEGRIVLTMIGVCGCVSVNELMEALGQKGGKVICFRASCFKICSLSCVLVHEGSIPFSLLIQTFVSALGDLSLILFQ